MWSNAKTIAAGDTVIVWLTRDALEPLLITPGKELNNRFGFYRHSDFIGVPYGSKVPSANGRGFVHVLRPTPELWTLALPHRTQILYGPDIAFVTAMLGLRPGSKVIEAGTGSGSFSHSIARTIGAKGTLYTYEFHEARAQKARDEFAAHGLSDIIDLSHRNVCKDGFGLTNKVDAVFLDLPAPWDAIPHAKEALRNDRMTKICCFSPCMEQVLRTASALNNASFTDVTMYETLLRPLEIAQISLPSPDDIAERLKAGEILKEQRRLKQIELARGQKRKHDAVDAADTNGASTSNQAAAGSSTPNGGSAEREATTLNDQKLSLSKAPQEVRSHTAFLTFATLVPLLSPALIPPNFLPLLSG